MLKALDSRVGSDEDPADSDAEDFDDMPSPDVSDDEPEEDVVVNTPATLPPPGVISKIRRLVRWIRQSPQRKALLERVIAMGNTGQLWRDANGSIVQIKARALVRDVKTRWDSTFLMIRRILEYRQVGMNLLSML
jgi:hypothetical protein